MPDNKLTSHLTQNTSLISAIHSWEGFLADKGRSPNTIKAFLSDVRLLTTFLPEDITLGKVTTKDLNRYFEWMEKETSKGLIKLRGLWIVTPQILDRRSFRRDDFIFTKESRGNCHASMQQQASHITWRVGFLGLKRRTHLRWLQVDMST